jgi:NAD(P)-dependent dehydrogenase (short-subunit alcohol dehydrogenase family)
MIAVPADVSKPDSVEEMVRQVEDPLGHITLLVNNAGATGPVVGERSGSLLALPVGKSPLRRCSAAVKSYPV